MIMFVKLDSCIVFEKLTHFTVTCQAVEIFFRFLRFIDYFRDYYWANIIGGFLNVQLSNYAFISYTIKSIPKYFFKKNKTTSPNLDGIWYQWGINNMREALKLLITKQEGIEDITKEICTYFSFIEDQILLNLPFDCLLLLN